MNRSPPEQLHLVWLDFAEQRKKFQAEYQLLIQPFEIRENNIIIQLLSTVQESMLNNFKSDLITHLRDGLRNNSILVVGELREQEEKQMLYTPRDKFEYLLKNPVLKKLRDRLGLGSGFLVFKQGNFATYIWSNLREIKCRITTDTKFAQRSQREMHCELRGSSWPL